VGAYGPRRAASIVGLFEGKPMTYLDIFRAFALASLAASVYVASGIAIRDPAMFMQ
jgi:hypothetical protein